MPREIVHWYVLDRAVEASAVAAPRAAALIDRHPAAVYLGAMAYDAPYYYGFGGTEFEQVADYLHGKDGEDTFVPLRGLAAAVLRRPEGERPPLWAFLLGMVSHYAADIELHPVISYLTGDYYHPDPEERWQARARHRELEVYLDSWMRPRYRQERRAIAATDFDFLLLKMLRSAGVQREAYWSMLEEVLPAPAGRGSWSSAFFYMAVFQRCFFSSTLGAALRAFEQVNRPKFGPIEALFSLGRRRPEPAFDAAFGFRNPVTGEEHRKSIIELVNAAAVATTALFARFEPLITGASADPGAELSGIVGQSLSYGGPNRRAEDATFFAEPLTVLPQPGAESGAR